MIKILLIITALIVIFGTFIVFANKSTKTPSSTNKPAIQSQETTTPTAMKDNDQVANVILGDSGFVPKDIAVKAGTTVVWKNSTGKAATVSSNDHPTHQMYPFLNLGEFPNSSSLQVVFDEAGKYSYHDHYNASRTGTVTVK